MKTTKFLLWIAYISFVLSIVAFGIFGIIFLKNDFNIQDSTKNDLKAGESISITRKFELPMNFNIEYYFSIKNGEVLVDSYFLKIQKKFLTNTGIQQPPKKDADFPKLLTGNLYSMAESDSYLYLSIPYSSIKATLIVWKLYSISAFSFFLIANFLSISFLKNCNKGKFFISENATYIRMISYLAISYCLASYAIQWIIFKGLNNNSFDPTSINLDSVIDFNWTLLTVSFFLLLIAQAFTEGIKLKEEQELTI